MAALSQLAYLSAPCQEKQKWRGTKNGQRSGWSGNGEAHPFAKMPFVTRNQVDSTSLQCRCQNGPIFGGKLNARRKRCLSRIGDDMGEFEELFQPLPVLITDTISPRLIRSIERRQTGHGGSPPEREDGMLQLVRRGEENVGVEEYAERFRHVALPPLCVLQDCGGWSPSCDRTPHLWGARSACWGRYPESWLDQGRNLRE